MSKYIRSRTSYLDASALAKWVLDEPHSEKFRDYIVGSEDVYYVTPLCFAEALGVLKTKWVKKSISQDEYLEKCEELVHAVKNRSLISLKGSGPLDESEFQGAIDLARKHGIDVSDALQLVTIKEGPDYTAPFQTMLVTADGELGRAARSEGIKVWNLLISDLPPDE